MNEVCNRVSQRLNQRKRAGDADTAREQVRNRKGDSEVHDRKAAGLCEAQFESYAHLFSPWSYPRR
jgi:hypothetical protein